MAEWPEKGSESVLHNLYEKARYSKDGCAKEDLDRYKSIDENYHKYKGVYYEYQQFKRI